MGAVGGHTKGGQHLVEKEQRAVLITEIAAAGHKARLGNDTARVVVDRLHKKGRSLCTVGGEGFLKRLNIIEGQHDQILG